MTGQIEAIHIAPAHGAAMHSQDSAQVLEGAGIEGDRYAASVRAGPIMLMPVELLERLDLWPGSVRENLTTRGIDVMALPAGTRLRIGQALLEVTGPAPPCRHNDTQRSGWRSQLGGQRGLLCRAVEGGVIRVSDRIEQV